MPANHLDQPIGQDVTWKGAQTLPRSDMDGRFCKIEPLNIDRHASDLYAAYSQDKTGGIWTYMFVGPFESEADFRIWLSSACLGDDPLFHAVINKTTGKAAGLAAFMRIVPDMGVIEVGNISFSPCLQRTPAATEAMFLMMQRVFALGYRRYEWKCDNLNAPSHKAAKRLGFTYEGLFRQALVYKGRNRDTAWFSVLDTEWPKINAAFTSWLDPSNFDENGVQLEKLETFLSK